MKRKRHKNKKGTSADGSILFALLAGFALLLLPLVYSNKVLDTSLFPRLLALFLFLTGFILLLSRKKWFQKTDPGILFHPAFIAAYVLVAITAFSLLFAVNVSAGLFDVAKSAAVVIFMACAAMVMLITPEWPIKLSKYFVVGAAISLTIGYYQYFFVIGFGFHDRHIVNEVRGLMSNINLYANYLMMLIPFLVYGIIVLRRRWRLLALVVLSLNLLMLFLLQTRAVYVGLLSAIPITVFLVVIWYRRFGITVRIRNRIMAVFFGLIVTGGVTLYALPDDNIYINRVKSIFSDQENPRISMWRATMLLIGDQPLTGAGAGNYSIRIQEYYNQADLGDWAINWIRPHNDYLWVASEKGIPGLVVFLMFFGLLLFYAIRYIYQGNMDGEWGKERAEGEEERDDKYKWLALLLIMALVSYMVNSFFDFPLERINHQVVLALFAASLVALTYKRNTQHSNSRAKVHNGIIFIIMVFLLAGIFYTVKGLRMEHYMFRVRTADVDEDWQAMLVASRKAATPWRTLDPLAVPVSFMEGLAQLRLNNFEEALRILEISRTENPSRKYILQNLGLLYNHFGRYDDTIEVLEDLFRMHALDDLNARVLSEAYYYKERYHDALKLLEAIPESMLSEKSVNNMIHIRAIIEEKEEASPELNGDI